MPRPFKGGKKKSRGKRFRAPKKGPLVLKDKSPESSELYGKVSARLGGKPPILLIECEDGVERKCVVRGKMIKKVWMNPGDIVLINYNRESSECTGGEISRKYTPDEVSKLKKLNEITSLSFKGNRSVVSNNITFSEMSNDIDESKQNENYYGQVVDNSAESSTFVAFDDDADEEDFEFDFDKL